MLARMECKTDIIEDPFIAARMGKRDVGKADFQRFFFRKFRLRNGSVWPAGTGRSKNSRSQRICSRQSTDLESAAVISLKYEEKTGDGTERKHKAGYGHRAVG